MGIELCNGTSYGTRDTWRAPLRPSPPPDRDVAEHLLAHLSPLGWEPVNLTGDYVWGAQGSASEILTD
jgi:hypothetical protein